MFAHNVPRHEQVCACCVAHAVTTTCSTRTCSTRCGCCRSRSCRSATATSCPTRTADAASPSAPASWYVIIIIEVLTASSRLPFKLPGHGTRWLLNWFKRLADGSHLSPRTAERQYFCSSACPLPFNEEMRSPSSARSLPPINHPLQSFLA